MRTNSFTGTMQTWALAMATAGIVVSLGSTAVAASTFTLDKPAHFTAADGSDVIVEPGTYTVDLPPLSQLRLSVAGKPALTIMAHAVSHNEQITAPLAGTIKGEDEDALHVVLLLPNGQALDATGSLTGTTSRGVNLTLLSAAQVKTFAVQAVPIDNSPVVLGTSTQPVNILGPLTVNGGPNGPYFRVLNSNYGGGIWARTVATMDLPPLYSPVHLCVRATTVADMGGNLLTRCTTSQSSLRYKTDVQPYLGGLGIINRLNPVHFAWKEGGQPDLGLIAEEVAQVEPLLTFKNEKEEIEGVKYETLTVALINAIKEQKNQIEELRQQLRTQTKLLEEQAH